MSDEQVRLLQYQVEDYLSWLRDNDPAASNQIAYVDILDDGSINFITTAAAASLNDY